MKATIRRIFQIANLFGIDPLKALRTFQGAPAYIADYRLLKSRTSEGDDSCKFGSFYPCIDDRYSNGGQASGHYFHQDLLVASKVFEKNPRNHIDVGSRIDGFVAHVASFRPVSVIDIRPLASNVRNIEYLQADMMAELPVEFVDVADSVSCLHALEHFGLGRYGDPVCWDGHLKGFRNLMRMLKKGGTLYLSVPIGEQRIEFNAHRVFSVRYLLKMLKPYVKIADFSFVDDKGELHESIPLDDQGIVTNFGCEYGCGIFECVKDHSGLTSDLGH